MPHVLNQICPLIFKNNNNTGNFIHTSFGSQETVTSKTDRLSSNHTVEMFKQNMAIIHLSLGMLEPFGLNVLKCAKPLDCEWCMQFAYEWWMGPV